jgi:hypothetical protein
VLERAEAYVRVHGEPFDQARLAALTGTRTGTGIGPGVGAGAGIAAADADADVQIPRPQNPDGGWAASWSGGLSSLDVTCHQLDLLADLDGRSVSGVDRTAAFEFVRRAQVAEGGWLEGPSDRTPDWLMPGSAAARVYLTAKCARALLRYGSGLPEVEWAAQALEWSIDPLGRLPGPLEAHWLAARVLRDTGRPLPARRLLDVVGRSFEQLDPVQLAWFGSDAVSGDRWTRRIAARLASLQQEDGSWIGEDGVPSAALTVTACRALLHDLN